jgi:hypothetical protein
MRTCEVLSRQEEVDEERKKLSDKKHFTISAKGVAFQ